MPKQTLTHAASGAFLKWPVHFRNCVQICVQHVLKIKPVQTDVSCLLCINTTAPWSCLQTNHTRVPFDIEDQVGGLVVRFRVDETGFYSVSSPCGVELRMRQPVVTVRRPMPMRQRVPAVETSICGTCTREQLPAATSHQRVIRMLLAISPSPSDVSPIASWAWRHEKSFDVTPGRKIQLIIHSRRMTLLIHVCLEVYHLCVVCIWIYSEATRSKVNRNWCEIMIRHTNSIHLKEPIRLLVSRLSGTATFWRQKQKTNFKVRVTFMIKIDFLTCNVWTFTPVSWWKSFVIAEVTELNSLIEEQTKGEIITTAQLHNLIRGEQWIQMK